MTEISEKEIEAAREASEKTRAAAIRALIGGQEDG